MHFVHTRTDNGFFKNGLVYPVAKAIDLLFIQTVYDKLFRVHRIPMCNLEGIGKDIANTRVRAL